MNEKLVSVIVPVYNCENFLDECLKSICNQTYRKLEIILVNDGSVDSSIDICRKYEKIDNRIVVIDKKHEGLLATRAKGVHCANGEYIGFVDSDDWIEPEMYEYMITNIGDNDLLTTGMFWHRKFGEIEEVFDNLQPGEYYCSSEQIWKNMIISSEYKEGPTQAWYISSVVNKLFSSSILKSVIDKANVNVLDAEDYLLSMMYILKSNKVRVTDKVFYHYRFNPNSIVNTLNPNYLTERTVFYNTVLDAIKGHEHYEELKLSFQKKFMFDIYATASARLGIEPEADYPNYVFPKEEILRGKKVAIFGTGSVGKAYGIEWKKSSLCEIVCFFDNNPKRDSLFGIDVLRPEMVNTLQYDYVVCAVLSKGMADAMRNQLVGLGVEPERIIWEKPQNRFIEWFFKS